jgi:hypothetical protein
MILTNLSLVSFNSKLVQIWTETKKTAMTIVTLCFNSELVGQKGRWPEKRREGEEGVSDFSFHHLTRIRIVL